MNISPPMKSDLQWWINNIHSQVRQIRRENPSVIIHTDSSRSGWGAKLGTEKIGGHWLEREQEYHINALEMLAVLFALQAFQHLIKGKYIKVFTDSTTTVSYVNNFGGVKSYDCNQISQKIWQFCIDNNMWIMCAHIPGTDNVDADQASREFKDNIEWSLDSDILAVFV